MNLHRAGAALGVLHWRQGWLWSVGLALLACSMVLEIAQNRPLSTRLTALHPDTASTLLARATERTAQSVSTAPHRRRGLEMEVLLGGQGSFESQYQRLIDIASVRGIELPRAAYVTTWDEPGGLRRVQVSLSMAARYPQFRSFIEEALRALPGVSLDQFAVKRDNVSQGQIDVIVQMSFWALREPPMQPTAHPVASRRRS